MESISIETAGAEIRQLEDEIRAASKIGFNNRVSVAGLRPGKVYADRQYTGYRIKSISPKRRCIMAWELGWDGEPLGDAERLDISPYWSSGTGFGRSIRVYPKFIPIEKETLAKAVRLNLLRRAVARETLPPIEISA